MSDQPRDWDRELADIDRLMAKQGAPTGSPTPAPMSPRGPLPAGPAPVRRRSVALTWFWVVLAIALALALVLWPYQKACGLQLFFFLGAAGVALIVGCLGALNSWAHRRGFAHILSLLVILWAGIVAAREILPRVGYARDARTWTCAAAPVSAPAGQNPAPATAPSSQTAPVPSASTPTQTQPAPASPAPAAP
ncbi:MAG TPA: hypothetical protein VFJ81_11045 [Gemmatimonadales bacterium]|nr:hypothetical protein [Gemmatimonadales bacterium]